MSYSDNRFYTRREIPAGFNVDFGTGTGTGSADYTMADVAATLPQFNRRTKVTGFKFRVTAADDADVVSLVAAVKNGTATFGTATLAGGTADQIIEGSITSEADSVFSSDSQPTIDLVVTSTGTNDPLGDYDVWLETQELFDSASPSGPKGN